MDPPHQANHPERISGWGRYARDRGIALVCVSRVAFGVNGTVRGGDGGFFVLGVAAEKIWMI